MNTVAPGADPARLHWRRQLELTIAGVTVGLVAFGLVALSLRREADVHRITLVDGRTVRSVSYASTMWPAAIGLAALGVLAMVLLVHAWRVARFTFRRRGDN